MGQPSLNYYQTVNVGKIKTDVIQYTSVQSAIDAVTDNTSNKRYLVRVHPGTYTEKITMKSFIDLIAVGGREETVINFVATAGNEATLTGEDCLVKGFTISTDSTSFAGRCVQNATTGFEIEDCILSVTAPAGTEIVFNATMACAIRDCQIDTAGGSAAGLTIAGAATITVDRTTINSATDAVQVTAAGTLTLTDCTIQNLIDQDAGTINIVRSRVEEVAIGTAGCTMVAELTRFTAAFATADAVAHTITCHKCTFNGQNFNNAATGATTINLRDCDGIATLTNAGIGGTVNLYDCGVETLTTSAGTVIAYGGRINACGGSTGTSFVWWQYADELKVIANMKISHALTAAAAGDVIRVMPGTYAESNLTLKASVNLVGTDPDQCLIVANSTATPVINSAFTCTLSNLTIGGTNAANPALSITANTLTIRNCYINGTAAGDAITMVAGTLSVYGTTIGAGDINLSTAICTLNMYGCRITTDPIDTAGAFAHVLIFEHCDFGAQAIASAATAATVITIKSCSNVGAITHAGTGVVKITNSTTGAITNSSIATMDIKESALGDITQAAFTGMLIITNCSMGQINNGAAGQINLYGSCWFTGIDTNAGVLTWKTTNHSYRVVAGAAKMKIMDAADDASAGDTILIGPGTFTEALDLDATKNACTYKGFGRDKTIITQATNTVLVDAIGTAAIPVVLEDLTIKATAGTDATYALLLNSTAGVAAVTLRNVTVDMVGTGAVTVHGLRVIDGGASVGTVVAYNSYIKATTGGTANYAVSTLTTVASTITLYDCILNGTQYDVYNNYLTCTMHSCELNGGGVYIVNNAAAICVTDHPEAPATVTPVTFAGAAGEFADLTRAELYTCAATVLISEAVYVSAANTVAEATNAVGAPIPAEGVVIYKPAGAAGTTCYVKNSGMAYMATPPAVWAAGTNVWLGVAGGQVVARPTNALKQVLGVGVDSKRMLINIASVEVVTEWLNIPIAWGTGSAPAGTHTDGNSRRAVAIATAAQTVFSQAVAIPEGFLAFSKLYVTVFPNATGTFDWTAYSSAASSGQDEATHSDTATADAQAATDDIILDHDISGAADGYTMVEKDIFSAELIIDVLTTITQVEVLGFRLEYSAQRGA